MCGQSRLLFGEFMFNLALLFKRNNVLTCILVVCYGLGLGLTNLANLLARFVNLANKLTVQSEIR